MTRAVSPTATRSRPATNVVAGVADETVDQETIVDRLRDLAPNSGTALMSPIMMRPPDDAMTSAAPRPQP
jgi:hypothetical protein